MKIEITSEQAEVLLEVARKVEAEKKVEQPVPRDDANKPGLPYITNDTRVNMQERKLRAIYGSYSF